MVSLFLHPLSSVLKAVAPVGFAIAWGMGSSPALVHAQEMGVNAIAANVSTAPQAKVLLYVNVNTGQDDLSAGRSESTPFKTISYALTQAQPGTVVQVASGLYTQQSGETFPLVVPKGVTVQGSEFNQGSTVTVVGGGRFASSWWGSQDVTFLAKADSQIVGFTVTNPNSRGTGIWIEAANVVVRGCTFTKSAREGVFAAGKANPTIENNLFVDNSANGLALTGMSTGMVRNNAFQKTGFGIAVSEKAAPQLINNRIQDNVDGIVVSHSASPILRGNMVEGNRRDGLVAISTAKPDLGSISAPGRNIFRNNGRYALYNATSGGTLAIEGNDVSGTTQMTALAPTTAPEFAASPELPEQTQQAAVQSAQPVSPSVPPASATVKLPSSPQGKGSKSASRPTQLQEKLKKAPTVQYKGKTYVLMESVLPLMK
ncbi:MAG: DUF1565 domain-containing protein [Thermosynechococcaceae cyanobacterium MS004]|nr:DUF1565 domain-containing protein [Thermosynechococcaceae cyanobacterium MS004]